jgi:hypothetical protein
MMPADRREVITDMPRRDAPAQMKSGAANMMLASNTRVVSRVASTSRSRK